MFLLLLLLLFLLLLKFMVHSRCRNFVDAIVSVGLVIVAEASVVSLDVDVVMKLT